MKTNVRPRRGTPKKAVAAPTRQRRRGEGGKWVYETLRREILTLRFEPGSSLDESELERTFGVSRTPLREALIRLSAEGLVQLRPNKGARVAPMDIHSLREHHEALELMHRVVARWAAARRTKADLEQIRACQQEFEQAMEREDVDAMLAANHRFHCAIGAACRNRYVEEQYARLLNEGQRYAYTSMLSAFRSHAEQTENWNRIVKEHRAIIEAIERQDVNECDRLTMLHAKNGQKQLFEYMSLTLVSDVDLGTAQDL